MAGSHHLAGRTAGPRWRGSVPTLSLSWYPDHGYEVQCFESPQKFESDFLASSSSLSPPEVHVELGGQGQELWPRELFLSFESALQATKYLLNHGREDPSLLWVPIDKFPRRSVKRGRERSA